MVRGAAVVVGMCLCVSGMAQRVEARIARPEAVGAPQVDASLGAALRSLTSRAGVVFVGQVTAVQRVGGVVEVMFRVDEAVQGPVGATYTLREWAGLWSAGQPRYQVGQRAMVFLLPPNGAGLSSPVDGMEGVVPVVPMGADAAPLLDVRRLATRVQRAVGSPLVGEAVALPDAVTAMRSTVEPPLRRLPAGWVPQTVRVPVPFVQYGAGDASR